MACQVDRPKWTTLNLIFILEFQFLMSEVPLYMCLNFEYTVSPELLYMYT